MKRYAVTLHGKSPLLMHRDNISFGEKVRKWQIDPQNKKDSVAGDDRSPAWTWIGYLYSDGQHVGIDSDNLMTMLREGGSRLLTGKKNETYKKQTQYGILLDQIQFDFFVRGEQIPVKGINALVGNNDFAAHEAWAEDHGFELLTKRARICQGKHVRVRPMFRDWIASGTLTVLDEDQSGLTRGILQRVLDLAGSMCGLGDWRPSSKTPGSFGRFAATVEPLG